MREDDSQPPYESVPPESSTERGSAREGRRRRLEGVIPEIVRRAVELGVEKAQEAPDNLKSFVGDLKVPKEIGHYLLTQIDETKNGLFRVVAKEIRDFLEHTNFSGELQKLLTTVQFEVNTTIRFTPNGVRSRTSRPPEAPAEQRTEPKKASPTEDAPTDEVPPTPEPESAESDVSLPRPEVKTAVHVRRDDRERRRRRDRDT